MEIAVHTEAEFRTHPIYYLELAHEWAGGGPAPDARHEAWLKELPRPLALKSAAAREALWGVLAFPERGRALAWLDRMEILQELLPCWSGDENRRALRLAAVEEVHRERWAGGLGNLVYEWLCVYQDQKVGRLGGWAMTGLATLLLEGDDPAETFAARVHHDLLTLGARAEVIERVTLAIHEYPKLHEILLAEQAPPTWSFSPTAIVAVLSGLMAMPQLSMKELRRAIGCAETLLLRYAAPDAEPGHKRRKG